MKHLLHARVLTISDSRTPDDDHSGDYLAQALAEAGHQVLGRAILPDDPYRIRAEVAAAIADPQVQLVLCTGGTGFGPRDRTPEAVLPLLDRQIPGFGEVFRAVSIEEIGMATLQSRALGGVANDTLVFCLPGSTSACRTAWQKILRGQLDGATKPCNFAEIFGRPDGQG